MVCVRTNFGVCRKSCGCSHIVDTSFQSYILESIVTREEVHKLKESGGIDRIIRYMITP